MQHVEWRSPSIVRYLAAIATYLFLHGSVTAQAPSLEHYSHTAWTTKEGLPGTVITMAQTPDGWLWLCTSNGLYRFDGKDFYTPVIANGERLLSNRIYALTAESNGDLYIGYEDHGLSVLHEDGQLEHLAPAGKNSPITTTYAVVRDIDGTIWAATSSGLMHLEHGRWMRISSAQGFSNELTQVVMKDGGGGLWAATSTQLFRYERKNRRFVRVEMLAPKPGDEPIQFTNLVTAPDGRLWNAEASRFIQVPMAAPKGGRPKHANRREGSFFGLFDQDANLWTLRCPIGICQAAGVLADSPTWIDVASVTTSRLDKPWQLASLAPGVMLEDQEGNIWIASGNTLERFRKNALTPVALPAAYGAYHIAPDSDGSVWILAPEPKRGWKYDPISRRSTELPGKYRGAARSVDGTVVLLTEDGIRRRRHGVEDRIALPVLPPGAWLRTDGERLWLGGANTPVRIWNERDWQTLTNPKPSEFTFSAPGRQGQMWRGLVDGRLLLFEGGRITKEFDQATLGEIGTATCLSAVPELVVCGEAGVTAWDGRRFRRLRATRDELLRRISGMVVTSDGTRWLNGSAGLLRIEANDWRRSLETGVPLRTTLFDSLDGYPGSASSSPSLSIVGNRLWVATNAGIVEINPSVRTRNQVAPQVALLKLSGDGTPYPLSMPKIRAGTMRMRFEFTTPALRKPERVMFSYRIDGVDESWQTSSERSATYTGLSPGTYRFRVRAMNEDGVWSESDRTLEFELAPTVMQTVYFKLACSVAFVLLLWVGYRLRLRYLTRSLNRRHEAQLEERARIARELHDSLLQNFQGAVLNMKAALGGMGADSPLHQRLQTGVREANAAITEGREKVEALRSLGACQPNLIDYLRQVGEREAMPHQYFALSVVGPVRPIQPVVEQELCAIGNEDLRNAFRHAKASRHEVMVEYGIRSLVLSVRDDGRGIDAESMDKAGHWGLRGIEERARLIHAEVNLQTEAGRGTTWRVEIKAALAYVESGTRGWWRLWH